MQAVELVNGETLNHWVWRGAEKMLGELPPEPASLFSRQVSGAPGRGGAPAAGAGAAAANATVAANAAGVAAPGAVQANAAPNAVPNPAPNPEETAYSGWMNTINVSDHPLVTAVTLKDVTKASTEAEKMAAAFDSVLSYWKSKKADDAIALAQTALDAAKIIATTKDAGAQDDALTKLLGTCNQCHTAHRMPRGQGQFAISTEVLAAGAGPAVAPPAPPVPFDIDVSKSQKLYLIVEDGLSTAPDRATPIWQSAVFTTADGAKVPLASLRPLDASSLRDDSSPIIPLGGDKDKPVTDAIRVKFPSVLEYDISNRGFTKFEGIPTFENTTLAQGEGVTGRFFIFDQQPGMDRLAPPAPETPLPPDPPVKNTTEAVDRVYWYLLGRAPSLAERQMAMTALRDPAHPDRPGAAALADLLWSVMMSPEFQFIR
jgi:hypothetical protein